MHIYRALIAKNCIAAGKLVVYLYTYLNMKIIKLIWKIFKTRHILVPARHICHTCTFLFSINDDILWERIRYDKIENKNASIKNKNHIEYLYVYWTEYICIFKCFDSPLEWYVIRYLSFCHLYIGYRTTHSIFRTIGIIFISFGTKIGNVYGTDIEVKDTGSEDIRTKQIIGKWPKFSFQNILSS